MDKLNCCAGYNIICSLLGLESLLVGVEARMLSANHTYNTFLCVESSDHLPELELRIVHFLLKLGTWVEDTGLHFSIPTTLIADDSS